MGIRVGVVGAAGRMGSATAAAVRATEDLTLCATLDLGDPLDRLSETGAQVAVDFTTPSAVLGTVEHCVRAGIHVVVGTSGVGPPEQARIGELLSGRPGVGVIVVPNFSIGAVLMMHLAELAAPFFESVEIVEMHHPDKIDAPSGTARRTAELVAAARSRAGLGSPPDATSTELAGARGARVDGVAVHSVRLRGLLAHQEVLLGGPGETLTLRHDSTDRSSFMPGVLTAVRAVLDRPGLTVGLQPLLGLGEGSRGASC